MNDLEKLRVILPHWIGHNAEHGREFARWADLIQEAGEGDIAELLRRAERDLREAEKALGKALEKAGGPLPADHGHHHP